MLRISEWSNRLEAKLTACSLKGQENDIQKPREQQEKDYKKQYAGRLE